MCYKKSFRKLRLTVNYLKQLFRSRIGHFTVTGRNEDEQPFLLYHVNHVVLMRTIISVYFSSIIFAKKGKRLVSKYGQPQPRVHSKARIPSLRLQNGLLFLGAMRFTNPLALSIKSFLSKIAESNSRLKTQI